jgi:predicted TIM-barrel fold metal-dependent hydrolase
MNIIDAHTHIASLRYIPEAFIEGIVDNMMEEARGSGLTIRRAEMLDRVLSQYQDEQALTQLRVMDKLQVEQAVLLLPDFTFALKGCALSIAEMFEEHAALLERHAGRFVVFAGVDPRWGRDGLDLFVKGIERFRFSGLKLYPPCGYTPDDPLLDPFYEYCDAHRLPVLLHIGPTSPALSFSEAHPRYVDAPARRFKNISFILAHGAVNYAEECIQLCRYRPNVYLDMSGARLPTDSAELGRLYRSGIAHKVIFGSDWPLNQLWHIKGMLDSLLPDTTSNDHPSRSERELMLGGTIRHILSRTGAH